MEFEKKSERISDVVSTLRTTHSSQKIKKENLITAGISNNQTSSFVDQERQDNVGNNTRVHNTKNYISASSLNIREIEVDENAEKGSSELPEAQELRYERPDKRRRPYHPYSSRKPPTNVNRRNVFPETARPPITRIARRPTDQKRRPTTKECTFFTKTVCLETVAYPLEAILRSIQSNKEMVTALLADFKIQESGTYDKEILKRFLGKYEDSQETKYETRFESNQIKRRSDYPFDNVEEGFTCSSQVQYARPQLAKAASGLWKYIINTGEHTQTLRLEKCSNPQLSCSFISENYRSSCVQVYNYHRLLTWDIKLGLHMDIFKVPTCCSCHVHGYAEIYPPHQKNPPSEFKEIFPGADFAITDQKIDLDGAVKPSNYVNEYGSSYFDSFLGFNNEQSPSSFASEDVFPDTKSKQPILDLSQNRSTYIVPGRILKKPASISRPYNKLPQQHAPNTRAPGYTGSLTKNMWSNRPNRPFRRESTFNMEDSDAGNNITVVNRYNRPYNREESPAIKKQSGHVDELDKPQRRVNYNYHPIIDFFKPHASMLQAEVQTEKQQPSFKKINSDLWKPVISS